jgi:hypothetical protein
MLLEGLGQHREVIRQVDVVVVEVDDVAPTRQRQPCVARR